DAWVQRLEQFILEAEDAAGHPDDGEHDARGDAEEPVELENRVAKCGGHAWAGGGAGRSPSPIKTRMRITLNWGWTARGLRSADSGSPTGSAPCPCCCSRPGSWRCSRRPPGPGRT